VIKRILLIVPPDTRLPDMLTDRVRIGMVPPLGIAYIASVLEQQGIDVSVLDCVAERFGCSSQYGQDTRYGMTDAEIRTHITFINPDMVGVSCLFSNKAFDAHNVCRIAKEVNPNIITVMGGAHPSALPEETLKDKNVDYVCKGEGEAINPILAGYVARNEQPPKILSAPQAVWNLDLLSFPARHLLPMNKYLSGQSPHSGQKRTPATTITTSRGCPGQCTFCAIKTMWGDSYRVRSPENVLAEIDSLIKTYGIRELNIEDDNFTANKKRAMAILQGIIDRKYDLALNSPSGLAIFAMDEELLDKMREAGYYSVSFAIESGDQYVLKELMHKRVSHEKAKRLIRHARDIGMKTKAFYIGGYPGESLTTMARTTQCAYDMGADWSLFFAATPLPGTPMLKTCQDNGWLVDPNLDYRYSFFKPNIRTPEFTPEDVIKWRDDSNRFINFEHNINMREGKYGRAIEDFREIVTLYPNLQMAKEALANAKRNLETR